MMKQIKNYYRVFGVPLFTSIEEIKPLYKKLVKQFHPDINKALEAEAKMKELNEAYDTLGDPDKKAQYDRLIQPIPPPVIRFYNPFIQNTQSGNTTYTINISGNGGWQHYEVIIR